MSMKIPCHQIRIASWDLENAIILCNARGYHVVKGVMMDRMFYLLDVTEMDPKNLKHKAIERVKHIENRILKNNPDIHFSR